MKYDFRKLGIKILIISIIMLIGLSKLKIDLNIRLFIGTFSIGTGIFLMAFGNFNPEDHDNDE